MNKRIICIVLAMIFVLCCVMLSACAEHECRHVCPECQKCTDITCKDPVCADKCKGHTKHVCEHVCPVCGKCLDQTCKNPVCSDKCDGSDRIVYRVEEEFDNPETDFANWDNGEIKDMHKVEKGKLFLTNTGATDYPSKGRVLTVTIEKFRYLAVKVDSLEGSDAKWSMKVQFAQDETSSRVLIADNKSTGLLWADLLSVDGMPTSGDVTFTLYIYILGTNSQISIDYIRSINEIPTVQDFSEQGDISVTDGTLSFYEGVVNVKSDAGKVAKVSVPFSFPHNLVNMIDLYVTQVQNGSLWSLSCDDIVLVEPNGSIGAFGIDGLVAKIPDGKTTLVLSVQGECVFDRIAAVAYNAYEDTLSYSSDDELLSVWKEQGSAYVERSNGMKIKKVSSVDEPAAVQTSVTTNIATYPQLDVVVSALDNAKIEVYFGAVKVGEISQVGTSSFNLLSAYVNGVVTTALKFVVVPNDEGSQDVDVSATITEVKIVRNAEYSKNAPAPKGTQKEWNGFMNEQGNNADNFSGDAVTYALGGSLYIVQTSSEGYSKAEVLVKNVDFSVNRYLNIKIDAITDGAKFKVDVIRNVQLEGEQVVTVIGETNQTGVYTIDLYAVFGLNPDNATSQRVSFSIFIVGVTGSSCQVDYIKYNNTIDEAPQIIDVKPTTNVTVTVDEEVELSAGLKYHQGTVDIAAFINGQNVTEDVVINGIFRANKSGQYTVVFSYQGAQSQERTIKVVEKQPIIRVETESQSVVVNQDVEIKYSIANASEGATASIIVSLGDDDVTSSVLTDNVFRATSTGEYTVTFAYDNADSQQIVIKVVSHWTSTDTNITIAENDGTLTILAHNQWPKAQRTFRDMVIDDAPYLKISIAEATDANYKIEFGDDYYNDKRVIKAEGCEKGVFYIDLRQAPYEGKTDKPQTITFYIYAVGTNQKVVIDCFDFVKENPQGSQPKYVWTTKESHMTITQTTDSLVLHTEKDWPKAQTTINDMVIDNAPYLKISISSETTARYKIEFGDDASGTFNTIKAESDEKGVFYIDLRQAPYEGKFDTAQTITFCIFAVGTNQDVVIDCFEFITEAEYNTVQGE